ncbi:copper-binding protein [Ideonella sp.]|uniref:copper-binding protein n=1 Tax=Ideonella sp. TaxID=1929293 RepID=UPI0035B08020
MTHLRAHSLATPRWHLAAAALLTLAAAPWLAGPARAADAHDHNHAVAAAPAAAELAEGEVRRVDKAQGKLTLKHGPIANLSMPAMTMVFRVADPAMLDRVQDGDKVRFSAERLNGFITVTRLDALR